MSRAIGLYATFIETVTIFVEWLIRRREPSPISMCVVFFFQSLLSVHRPRAVEFLHSSPTKERRKNQQQIRVDKVAMELSVRMRCFDSPFRRQPNMASSAGENIRSTV